MCADESNRKEALAAGALGVVVMYERWRPLKLFIYYYENRNNSFELQSQALTTSQPT
jgi:hypothetical protein